MTVPAELHQVPLLIRGGSIVPTRERPRRSSPLMKNDPFTLRVALGNTCSARGELYVDDGETIDPPAGTTTTVELNYRDGRLTVAGRFGYESGAGWKTVSILGVAREPRRVSLNGKPVEKRGYKYDATRKVLSVDANMAKLGRFELTLDSKNLENSEL